MYMFNILGLDMGRYGEDSSVHSLYDLVAVMNFTTDHFVAVVQSITGDWFEVDDETVTAVREEEV